MSNESNQKLWRDMSDPYRSGFISCKLGHRKIATIDDEVVTVRNQDGSLTRFRCHDRPA